MLLTADGARCLCCGDRWNTTGGCLRCYSKTYCGLCKNQIGCSCGNTTNEHRCPNVVVVSTTVPIPVL